MRTINWELSDYRSESQARGIAWGELQIEWHKRYGTRVSQWQCAGCGLPIGRNAVLDLVDGTRVHFGDGRDCLVAFGERWRREATAGLQALGLDPPAAPD